MSTLCQLTDEHRSALKPDEQMLLAGFRLMGRELQDSLLLAARHSLERAAAKRSSQGSIVHFQNRGES